MRVVFFMTFRTPPDAGPAPLDEIAIRLRAVAGLCQAVMHTPSCADDPYLQDEGSPQLVLQLYFEDLRDLEAAATHDGSLAALTDRQTFRWINGAQLSQQAMAVRQFEAPASFPADYTESRCTYLVGYEGLPRDYDAWLGHYLASHVPLMQRMPGIREIEVYTRLEWVSTLPAQRESAVQRNKVVFDSNAALSEALNSPIRHEMRRDFEASPPFDGRSLHFPMTSHVVPLATARPHTIKENEMNASHP